MNEQNKDVLRALAQLEGPPAFEPPTTEQVRYVMSRLHGRIYGFSYDRMFASLCRLEKNRYVTRLAGRPAKWQITKRGRNEL